MNAIFKDLKVVELASVLAGPAVGMFFAELGAEVIKIENKTTKGDVTRNWKLPSENPESNTSAYFASVNWNKKSLFLNLNEENERLKVLEIIKTADIVISNYKKGDDVKFGMDYDSLIKINSSIIYARLTGFGEDSTRTAFDIVLQAETGFMFMNGTSESGPVKLPVALIDILAAHQLKEGVLVALINRIKTGQGAKVSVSLYDAAVASLANQATNWLMASYDPQPIGSLHPNIAPYGEIFLTSDNKLIVLAVGSEKQFSQLCLILKREDLIKSEIFSSNSIRVKNRYELFEILKPEFKKFTSDDIMSKLISNEVPAGIIKSIKEVFNEENAKKLILKKEGLNTENFISIKSSVFSIITNS